MAARQKLNEFCLAGGLAAAALAGAVTQSWEVSIATLVILVIVMVQHGFIRWTPDDPRDRHAK